MDQSVAFETTVIPRVGTEAPHLQACVQKALRQYFTELDGEQPSDLYREVLDQIVPQLLDQVMIHTRGNQSRAADILGITRATLRSKLKRYNLA
ncbi:MAG: helix-turn-helix domain-containing protein [Pseudomonadota bacterium]